MGRHIDHEAVARHRSYRIAEPIERHRFMGAYRLGQQFNATGTDSYAEFQRMWASGDSAGLAGFIEGLASGQKLRPVMQPSPRHRLPGITHRQKDVLRLRAQGLSQQQVADRLNLSIDTVKTHIQNARRRLGAKSLTHAVTLAYATGQLTLPDLRERNH